LLGVVAIAAGGYYRTAHDRNQRDSIKNYTMGWTPPVGWKELPHGPQTLFLYRHPKSDLVIRGAVTNIVADINPTPDLDSDGIARHLLEVTEENMPGWKGEMLDEVKGDGTTFRLVRRGKSDRTVVSAFSVRGNCTAVITIAGTGKDAPKVERHMADFRAWLGDVRFKPLIYAKQ